MEIDNLAVIKSDWLRGPFPNRTTREDQQGLGKKEIERRRRRRRTFHTCCVFEAFLPHLKNDILVLKTLFKICRDRGTSSRTTLLKCDLQFTFFDDKSKKKIKKTETETETKAISSKIVRLFFLEVIG